MDISDEYNDGSEALIEPSRRMLRRGGVHYSSDISDQADYESLSPLLGMTWRNACQLNLLAVGRNDKFTGQAGLVNFRDGDILIVTALHNLAERNLSRPFSAALKIPGPSFDQSYQADFADMGTRDLNSEVITGTGQVKGTGFWEYGVDITLGSLCGVEAPKMAQLPSFEVIPRGSLSSIVGYRIAMAIFARRNATQETAATTLEQEQINEIYGISDEVNFLTGTVMGISGQFIFHNVNSYRGCAGAVLFLLEGDHQGRAFAVHVGSPKGITPKTNLGVDIWSCRE